MCDLKLDSCDIQINIISQVETTLRMKARMIMGMMMGLFECSAWCSVHGSVIRIVPVVVCSQSIERPCECPSIRLSAEKQTDFIASITTLCLRIKRIYLIIGYFFSVSVCVCKLKLSESNFHANFDHYKLLSMLLPQQRPHNRISILNFQFTILIPQQSFVS